MPLVRLAMAENTGAFVHSLHDMVCHQHARNRNVPTTETLPDCLDVRDDAFLFQCVLGTATAHAAHDLVENEECAVSLADGFHGREVAWYCWDAAKGLGIG